ncbi:hypothetical protein SynMEDNS5_01775 [Synechococcus sp. MEDNS5]|nr:hypothetical protein SynMEDNS5_01775 [Synechococcus sp. MEDNS5]
MGLGCIQIDLRTFLRIITFLASRKSSGNRARKSFDILLY